MIFILTSYIKRFLEGLGLRFSRIHIHNINGEQKGGKIENKNCKIASMNALISVRIVFFFIFS